MEEDRWIYLPELNEMINLKGCVNIYTEEDDDYDTPFQLKFLYSGALKDEITLWFDDEKKRENLIGNIRNILNPTEIDTSKEPLTL